MHRQAKENKMTTYQEQQVAVLEQALALAIRYQENLDSDAGESIHKDHALHVARARRRLVKAIKELAA
jgi:hypothetical protein